jgi:hypothetical protein
MAELKRIDVADLDDVSPNGLELIGPLYFGYDLDFRPFRRLGGRLAKIRRGFERKISAERAEASRPRSSA